MYLAKNDVLVLYREVLAAVEANLKLAIEGDIVFFINVIFLILSFYVDFNFRFISFYNKMVFSKNSFSIGYTAFVYY